MINITFTTGDIFTSNADILVNPVNTSAISGKGLAKEFAIRYPDNQSYLQEQCRDNKYDFRGGDILVHETRLISPLFIFNVFTKEDWRKPSKMQWIRHGMVNIREEVIKLFDSIYTTPKSIAIPKLGCGITTGQLDWNDVKPIIVTAFDTDKDVIDLEVLIYE